MNHEQFAKRILDLRKKKGYTQAQLAELLHVSHTTISRWETAEGYPDITLIKPLSDALGVSCDVLLSDENDVQSQHKEVQHYLPYGITLAALLLYYVMKSLRIPLLLAFGIFVAGVVFSFQLKLRETKQKGLPALTRWNVLLAYLPLVGLVGTVIFYMMSLMNGVQGMIETYAFIEVLEPNQLFWGLEDSAAILMSLFLASAVILLIVYFVLRHWFIVRCDITWKHLFTHQDIHEKEKRNPCFTKWTHKLEGILHVLYAGIAIVLCIIMFSWIYTTYRELIAQYRYTLPPVEGREDYAVTMSMQALYTLRKKLLCIWGGMYLLQLLPLLKCRKYKTLWLSTTLGFLYALLLLAQITFVDRIYMQIPIGFALLGGLILLIVYGFDLKKMWTEKK